MGSEMCIRDRPRLHDGTSQEGKKLFGSSAPGADAAEGASLLDLKAYGRERKGFQSTSRFDAHHGLEEHASVYTLQCFYRKRAERRNALAIKIARWYLYHDARYTHREMRKAEIAAAKKIQVFVKEVIRKTRLKISTRKKRAAAPYDFILFVNSRAFVSDRISWNSFDCKRVRHFCEMTIWARPNVASWRFLSQYRRRHARTNNTIEAPAQSLFSRCNRFQFL